MTLFLGGGGEVMDFDLIMTVIIAELLKGFFFRKCIMCNSEERLSGGMKGHICIHLEIRKEAAAYAQIFMASLWVHSTLSMSA